MIRIANFNLWSNRSVLFLFIWLNACFSFPLYGAWSVPINLSSGIPVLSSQIATDPSGNTALIWIENNGSSFLVQSIFQPVDRAFLPIVTLSEGADPAASPKILFDSSDNLIASWIQNAILKEAEKPSGDSWSLPAIDISNPGASESDMGIDSSSGRIVFIWNQAGTIVSRSKLVGSTLLDFVDLTNNSINAKPKISLNGSGYGNAIWVISSGPNPGIGTTPWSISNNGWISPGVVTPLGDPGADNPQLVVDPTEFANTNAVWELGGTIRTASASDFWSNPSTLSGPASSSPQIAGNKAGGVAIIWEQNGIIQTVYKLSLESDFSPIKNLSGPGSASPQIAIDDEGNLAAIWLQNNLVQVSVLPIGGAWSAPIHLTQYGLAFAPKINLDGFGHAKAAWVWSDGTNHFVQFSSTNLFLLPPSGLTGRQFKNRYLNTTELVNEIKWQPSPSKCVVGYFVYRYNYQMATVPKGKKCVYYDRNKHHRDEELYFVTAVDSAGNQSDSKSISIPKNKKPE